MTGRRTDMQPKTLQICTVWDARWIIWLWNNKNYREIYISRRFL